MRERIVYVLGAGFSRALGLPLMSDFLEMSKDLYFGDNTRYSHFNSIFQEIGKMGAGKTYLNLDLLNIEEVLSVLTIRDMLTPSEVARGFEQYIIDVIKASTPRVDRVERFPRWWYAAYGTGKWRPYLCFAGELLGVGYSKNGNQAAIQPIASGPHYSVITLNYDLVLETATTELIGGSLPIGFINSLSDDDEGCEKPGYLAKLHGCVRDGGIIPPTWNKGALPERTLRSWKLAHRLLSRANEIRIIGYSMPNSDSYFNYLLKDSVLLAPNLKKIDVICLAKTDEVEARYHEAFSFTRLRFINSSFVNYLQKFHRREPVPGYPEEISQSPATVFKQFEADHHAGDGWG